MKDLRFMLGGIGIIFALALVGAQAASPAAAAPAVAPQAAHTISQQTIDPSASPSTGTGRWLRADPSTSLRASLDGQCAINAVDLIGAWADAGTPNGEFAFKSQEDLDCNGTFEADILPLFTTEGIWFEGSQACTECHFDNTGDSRHEMDLGTYAGIMLGGDVLSEPPGVQIVVPGDWSASKLRARLRNNRMPPGWEFDIEEGNRNGPTLTVDGGEIAAVDLIAAWVDGGAPETEAFKFTAAAGAEHQATFEADVLPLFTEADIWFPGSQACTECHFDNSGDSRHEMDLGSYEGIMLGGDVLSEPPGVQIVVPGDWSASKLRGRLRDNRMPPGWFFDIEEGNRNGPVIIAGALVEAAVEPTAAATLGATVAPTAAAAPAAAPTPAPTRTETTSPAQTPIAVIVFGVLSLVAALAVLAYYLPRLSAAGGTTWTVLGPIVMGAAAILFAAAALYTLLLGPASHVTTIREEIRQVIEVTAQAQPGVIFETVEGRLEAWQAQLPPEYAGLTAPASDQTAIDAGRRIFRDNNCAVCHGPELKGDGDFAPALSPKPVNLTDKALMSLPFVTDNYLFWRLSEGGSQSPFFSAMPQWKAKLSEEERWQLVAFIRSQTAEVVASEDQAAIAVIEKAGCFACHRLGSRGGKIGPTWDGLGTEAATLVPGLSAEEYIRQSILDPGAFTVPGFEDQAEVMPRDFKDKLTPEEIDLIVQFLLKQTE